MCVCACVSVCSSYQHFQDRSDRQSDHRSLGSALPNCLCRKQNDLVLSQTVRIVGYSQLHSSGNNATIMSWDVMDYSSNVISDWHSSRTHSKFALRVSIIPR